jgi:hypothetical protein
MSITKTITTLVVTAIVGVFTFLFASPKKATKTSAQNTIPNPPTAEERDNLFI